jgi:sec-independent protein translocase protein TatC
MEMAPEKNPEQESGEAPYGGENESRMGFVDHLDELRRRIIYCLLAVAAGSVAGWFLAPPTLKFLSFGQKLQALGPIDPFMWQLKLSLILGVFLASPIIIIQVWLFVSPGLKPDERRFAFPTIFSAILLFFMGGALGAYMVPLTLKVLSKFLRGTVHPDYAIDRFVSFVGSFVIGLGLTFEAPVVLVLLAKLGIVSYKQLAKGRGYAAVISAIVAAVITPTGDPFTMAAFAVPLYLLYEITLIAIRFMKPSRRPEAWSETRD